MIGRVGVGSANSGIRGAVVSSGLLILGTLLAAAGVAACVSAAWRMGDNIPVLLLERDYLIGVVWGSVLILSLWLWPVSAAERKALVILWCLRLVVALLAMLVYEKQYDFLDSYTYFRESVDIALNGYVSDAAFGTRNTTYTFSVLWVLLPPSFHALKVTCAYIGLSAAFIFYRAWRVSHGGTSLWPLWIIGVVPSVLFWSSTLGKEPLILLGLAVASWGALAWRRSPSVSTACAIFVGLSIVLLVRPWVAGIFVAAFSSAFIIRPISTWGWYAWLAMAAAVVTAGVLYAEDIVEIVARGSFLTYLEAVSSSWAIGGSASELLMFSSVSDVVRFLPIGVFTALFRPLPGEIGGPFGLMAGLENAVTLVLVVWSACKLLRGPWTFALVFVVIFVALWSGLYAFLSYQNLGTAVRFKMQIVPFLMALIGFALARQYPAFGSEYQRPAQSVG